MFASFIEKFRNGIWKIRRWWKGDAFEHSREAWNCGVVAEQMCDMRGLLKLWGYEVNHVLQFEDTGQVLSGRKQYDWDTDRQVFKRQHHIRFFDAPTGLEVRAHLEYTPEYDPIKHVKAIDCTPGCDMFWEMYLHHKEGLYGRIH